MRLLVELSCASGRALSDNSGAIRFASMDTLEDACLLVWRKFGRSTGRVARPRCGAQFGRDWLRRRRMRKGYKWRIIGREDMDIIG